MNGYQEYVCNDVESTRKMYEQQQAYKKKQQMLTRKKQQRRAIITAFAVVAGAALVIFSLGTLFGWHLGTKHTTPAIVPEETSASGTVEVDPQRTITTEPAIVSNLVSYVTTEEPSFLHSDLIKADGVLLPYELQECMFITCEKYGVPYALALALAEKESTFNPDAKSSTNDYGLMQINKINFDYLKARGIDPMTYEGNIEAGILFLSQKLEKYGDVEKALMAYNCGDAGARRLWEKGTTSTYHSATVMKLYQKWQQVLEGLQ